MSVISYIGYDGCICQTLIWIFIVLMFYKKSITLHHKAKHIKMKFEFFFARRLRLSGHGEKAAAPNLTIAVIGMALAIVIMILSVTIVCGFKKEIANKIYNLDSHIKVTNSAVLVNNFNYSTVDSRDVIPVIMHSPIADSLVSISLIAEKPAILKTSDNFKGIVYRGVDSAYNWDYYNCNLVSGRLPNMNDTADVAEIIISKTIASQLSLKDGDSILTYFIDNRVRVRKSKIVGIFATDFDEYDNTYILGNIKAIQGVNGWDDYMGTYIGINTRHIGNVDSQAYSIYKLIANSVIEKDSPILYNVTDTTQNNKAYFAWLDLLDMNVVIILALMTIVSAFTLIAGLLMIVLERINMIGILKTLGASNGSIRSIFIYLTQKLILKSMLFGNLIGIIFALLQQNFHILKLDAEAYYIPYVPIDINWIYILLLNIGVLVVSYLTLLAPSMIISSIKPSKSIRFE